MIILLSPSKTQDFEGPLPKHSPSIPSLLEDSALLVQELKRHSSPELSRLMGISDKLGQLNQERFQQWQLPFNEHNARAAAFAFKGDVYDGLEAGSLSPQDMEFAQIHLRILSGLYGLLKPLDLMQPYRLEMKTKLKNPRGKDLYAFWGSRITDAINAACKEAGTHKVINLASEEYFKSVQPDKLEADIFTPVFKDYKSGTYKVIGLFAKRARGQMARHIIAHRLQEPEQLKAYTNGGYAFAPDMSDAHTLTFIRREMKTAA